MPGAVVGGALQQAGSGMPPAQFEDIDELREAARWLFRSNEANPDPNTSMVVASSALLGLYARRRSGRGQQIFVSMLGANTYANADAFVDYEGASPRQPLDAELHGPGPLYRLYEAREGWVFLAVTSRRGVGAALRASSAARWRPTRASPRPRRARRTRTRWRASSRSASRNAMPTSGSAP